MVWAIAPETPPMAKSLIVSVKETRSNPATNASAESMGLRWSAGAETHESGDGVASAR